MTTQLETAYKLIEYIENLECCDDNIDMLEKAMEYYCGTHDKCSGYKLAILQTLTDEYENPRALQDADDLGKLMEILNFTK